MSCIDEGKTKDTSRVSCGLLPDTDACGGILKLEIRCHNSRPDPRSAYVFLADAQGSD